MADQYEIREDSSNPHWSFVVWNLTKNWSVDRYPTREEAQKSIDQLSAPVEFDEDLFNMIPDPDYPSWGQAQLIKSKETPEEEAEFVSIVTHKVGDEIPDEDGNIYVAIQPSYYISDKDVANFEDGWDAQVDVGWHTPARLKSQSTQVIVEQVQAGQAEIVRRNFKTCVLFHDENQLIPLDDLAYNSEIGLYQKSTFPSIEGQ